MFTGFEQLEPRRPLVVLALRSTGDQSASSRITEIGAIRVEVDGRVIRRRQAFTAGAWRDEHRDTDGDVARAQRRTRPQFGTIARRLVAFLDGADLAGFRLAFGGLPVLLAECAGAGSELSMENRFVVDLAEMTSQPQVSELRELVRAHQGAVAARRLVSTMLGALSDAEAIATLLDAELTLNRRLPRTPQRLSRIAGRLDGTGMFRLSKGEIVFNFGRYYGRRLSEIALTDRDFLHRMQTSKLPADAIAFVNDVLETR